MAESIITYEQSLTSYKEALEDALKHKGDEKRFLTVLHQRIAVLKAYQNNPKVNQKKAQEKIDLLEGILADKSFDTTISQRKSVPLVYTEGLGRKYSFSGEAFNNTANIYKKQKDFQHAAQGLSLLFNDLTLNNKSLITAAQHLNLPMDVNDIRQCFQFAVAEKDGKRKPFATIRIIKKRAHAIDTNPEVTFVKSLATSSSAPHEVWLDRFFDINHFIPKDNALKKDFIELLETQFPFIKTARTHAKNNEDEDLRAQVENYMTYILQKETFNTSGLGEKYRAMTDKPELG